MRIFYAVCASPNPDVPSTLWRDNLLSTLTGIGHDVCEFNYDMAETVRHLDERNPHDAEFVATNRPRLTAELVDQIERAHAQQPVDIFFSYFYDTCVETAALDRIRALGIVTINWYCNASYQLHLVARISPSYDYCLVPEKCRLADYEALGARPLYCQEAANPDIYRPCDLSHMFDVTFVGQCYGDRAELVKWLRGEEIDIRVWGPRWDYHVQPRSRNLLKRWLQKPSGLPREVVGGVLSDADLVAMYSRSRINLGFSTCGDTRAGAERIVQIRLRDFEVPMCGGFYLVEHIDELQDFFEIGREIETYRSREEMLEKIRFYLAHDAERDRIRHAGRARCLRDHTWERRFAAVFRQIGLS